MEDIRYHSLSKKGPGLPFAILTNTEQPFIEKDFYHPSLRDFHAIFWFKKGSGKYYVDFREYEYAPNTVVLVSKDQVHYFEPPEKDWEVQSITFNSEVIYRNDTDLRHLFHFNISSHLEGQQRLQLTETDATHLADISRNLTQVYWNWEGKPQYDAFYHWLCLFLIYCEKIQQEPPSGSDKRADGHDQALYQFNELLEANYKSERGLAFYLDKLNLSQKMLSRMTQERYKISPKQVINERVLLEMKRLLRGTHQPIKQIAYDLGFGEPTNMVKYFKKYTGMTPSAFKNG